MIPFILARRIEENTNRLFKQYLPNSTDLSKYPLAELRRIQDSLDDRPLKILGFIKSVEGTR